MLIAIILFVLALILFKAYLDSGKEDIFEIESQPVPKDPHAKAITAFVKAFDFSGWNWADSQNSIIRCCGENGFYDKYVVVFGHNEAVKKLIRLSDMETLSLEPTEEVHLTDEALTAFFEASVAEEMDSLQALADEIAKTGPCWLEGQPFNNGEKPGGRELRLLGEAFERAGFSVQALRFSDGSLKLGLKES